MATEKPTTVEPEVEVVERPAPTGKSTNPLEVIWPLDEFGFTSMLRKEGVRAIGRIKGDDAKLAVFMATLRVLAEHAGVKTEDQKLVIEQHRAEAAARTEAEYARSEADKQAEVDRLSRLLAEAQANLAAKEAVEE